jgi:predicted Rossmann fold flavoprotein
MKNFNSNNKRVKIAIIGGGAAGMFAAASAALQKTPALLIERKARLGAKVLMTANGRCNFTKDISSEDFIRDVKYSADWIAPAIRECPPREIIKFFRALSIPLRRMSDGRMFPADGKAATVVHAFGDILRDKGLPVLTNCPVRGLSPIRGGGFVVHTQTFDIEADNVIIATGGASYPKTGSVGDGQNFARSLGHEIIGLKPGLIGMETANPRVTSHAGRRFEDGRAKVLSPEGRVLFDYRGEVDCEKFGLSGAAVYNCQRYIEHEQLKNFTLEVWFGKERLKFENLRSRPLKEAIVTIGGVSLDDVDNTTMQSKKVPGLYFAGEVLDIDGPTGGYNLTLAFATARKAVRHITRGEMRGNSHFAKRRF